MIQDIRPHILDNHFENRMPKEGDLGFYADDKNILLPVLNGQIHLPGILPGTEQDMVYAFSLDGTDCFLYRGSKTLESLQPLEENAEILPPRALRELAPRHLAYAAVTVWHLAVWYRNTVYCGCCGSCLIHDTRERMMKCPDCGNMIYPRISPAVIVAVTDGDRILMTKYAGRSYTRYALVAGFTEIGETPEETVSREVFEECGIHVKNIRYYRSQPWGFSQSLLMGFFCDLDGDRTIRLDDEELSVGTWVRRDEIDAIQDGYDDISLTNEMILRFRDGLV